MDLQLVAYLISMAVTAFAVGGFAWAWAGYARRAAEYSRLEDNLPDATRLPGLRQEVERCERDLAQLRELLPEAQLIVAKRKEAETWLETNWSRYDEARQELPTVTINLDAARAELGHIREQLPDAKAALAKKQEADAWLSANGALYEEARGRLPVLQAQLDALRQEVDESAQERDELRSEVLEGKQQREWLRQEDRRLAELVELQKAEYERARGEVEAMQSREAGLQATLEEVSGRLTSREQELRDVQAELTQAKLRLDEAGERIAQVTAEHERRKREIEEFKLEHQNLVKLLDAAEKRWSQLAPAAGGSEDGRLAELWRPVLFGSGGARVTEDESRCLADVESYLRAAQLRFPQRVVRAFHTSLKVSDISPLVVLAGISGTGKSELPRRYAQAMGMHFLNIPVQPRWDSPQDMFGFYNYLENRYRATELARALVQMDPFFAESGRGWVAPGDWDRLSRSKEMLLILLDEMNLARVEYYFSEFLSRLETRRGISWSNSDERRKAEITLEVGLRSLSKGNGARDHQPSMQVFVGSNVLFVGTMNEDESTQTLSDKVVDRANVQRFGRPGRFVTTSSGSVTTRPGRVLTHQHWRSWVRSPDQLPSNVSTFTDECIERLAQAMQLVRRPFAYRTYNGIRSYVANYPDASAYRDAVADQIELKILPKFRGLDHQENATRQALLQVRGVLEKLEDAKLVGAIDESLRQADHLFSWHGVDRSEV